MHEMPKPSEQHRKLHRFAGNWVGEEKLTPSPWGPGGPALGRLTGFTLLSLALACWPGLGREGRPAVPALLTFSLLARHISFICGSAVD